LNSNNIEPWDFENVLLRISHLFLFFCRLKAEFDQIMFDPAQIDFFLYVSCCVKRNFLILKASKRKLICRFLLSLQRTVRCYQISTMKCVNKLNSLVDDIVLVCCYQIWTIDTTGCVHSWQNLWTYCQRLSLTQYLFNLPSVADIICWIKFSNLLSSVIHMVVFVCLSAHIPVIYSRSFMYIYVYETFVCWLWPRFIFDRKTSNVC